jgi:glycosyltransferase involved in cell wall biosynthesis
MKIALLTHSYHRVTMSGDFLADILGELGTVETYFDESWAGCQADWVASFEPRKFDCIVILQAHECFQYLNPDHPNITFVPMYDAMIWQGAFYWREEFNCAKVLSFSSALYREVSVRNTASAYFQYYPDPRRYPKVLDYSAPRGYYWRRRNEINYDVIASLAKGFAFEHFTLHDVPDPGSDIQDGTHGQRVETAHYSITGWHSSEKSYLDHLSTHNIYFAPRILEGIGFGFLKAMSMGICVVAPNTPTHNEYIAQGCTGILYEPDKPDAVDLRRYREIGRRAQDSMERGRRRWEARAGELLEFFTVPKGDFQRRRFAVDSWIDAPRVAPVDAGGLPSVAVVTVCLNARNELEKTICSVTGQDYPGLEYAIFDGGSTDGTLDVIQQYERSLTFWTSGPDGGVYPAMQKSIDRIKSDWVLFLNAGDFLISRDALRRLFASIPRTADVVYGHHIFRHTNGLDEVRLASDFEWVWDRLQEGKFDVQYPAGFPSHQATAVRTPLLRKLKFDPLFRIAADHDLLWRAWGSGAKFFPSDEVVSVYVGGGVSARQMERCKQEWCVIALRYAPRKAAPLFLNCTYAEAAAAIQIDYGGRSESFLKKFGSGFGPLAKMAARAYLWTVGKFYLPSRGPFFFTRAGMPAFLSDVRGLSEPEEWGTWSEGATVELDFRERLPDSFTLIVCARAFGRNAEAAIPVTVGKVSRPMLMKGPKHREYRLIFNQHGGDNRILITIPHPTAPAELEPSKSSDTRCLGLGLVSMRIRANLQLNPPCGSA